ncbi:MAG: copper amine oxidase N-terminal domain-containing protein [Syntrophomonadaceae bacterium]|nr:copper amine oxidase N-terminal domain-containing protein [Syntrophomonadaceae bacterium]
MKKWFAVILILNLMIGGLTGCAKKASEHPQPSGQITVTVTDMPNKAYVQGSANKTTAKLEIKAAAKFAPGSTIEATITDAVWNQVQLPGNANQGWTNFELYNDNHSIRFTQSGESGLEMVTLVFPTINIDVDASLGDLKVALGGTAGATGEYVIAAITTAINLKADKPVIKVNALDQPAGNIIINEATKDGFSASAPEGVLKLSLPNGVVFARDPKVFYNGYEVNNIKIDAGGRGKDFIQWQGKNIASFNDTLLEKIEISSIAYNVDPRLTPKDIVVEVSGQVLTGPGGSTSTIASIANAIARSLTGGSASFVVGSTKARINGEAIDMDVAPYMQDNRVYVPLRFAANALGVSDNNIMWDQTNQTITLVKGDSAVQFKIGNKSMLLNGVSVNMDVAPRLDGNRVMLPIGWMAQAFGAAVTWDEGKQTISLAY